MSCSQRINLKDFALSVDASTVTEIKKITNSLYKEQGQKTSSVRTAELKMKSVLCEDIYTSSLAVSHTVLDNTTRYNGIEGSRSIKILKSCLENNEMAYAAEKEAITVKKVTSDSCNFVNISRPSNLTWIKNDLFSNRNDNTTAVCNAIGRARAYPDNDLC